MFPSVIAIRIPPNEVDNHTSGGLGFSRSRTNSGRESSDPSDSITVTEIPTTQFHACRSHPVLASKLSGDRKKQDSNAALPNHLMASKIALPQTTLKLPLERTRSVGDSYPKPDVKRSMDLTDWHRETMDVTRGHVRYWTEPNNGNGGDMTSSVSAIFVEGQSLSQSDVINVADRSGSSLQPPERSTIGNLGLSPRMNMRGSSPHQHHTTGLTKLQRGEAKSVERFPPLSEKQLSSSPQHRQQHRLSSQQHQQLRRVASHDERSLSTSPSSQTRNQLLPIDAASSSPLAVSGRSPQRVPVTKSPSLSNTASAKYNGLVNVPGGTPKRDVINGNGSRSWMSDCMVVNGGDRSEVIGTHHTSGNGLLDNDTTQTDYSKYPEIKCDDDDNEYGDDGDLDCDGGGDYDSDKNEENDEPEIDRYETGSNPVLTVRIEIARSSQRRTVVATSDVSSTVCDVIEKRFSRNTPSPGRGSVHDNVDKQSVIGTADDTESNSTDARGEHCLFIAGRGKFVVVDDSGYENFARRRQNRSMPRVNCTTGSQQSAPNGHLPLNRAMGYQHGVTKRNFSK